MPAMRAECADQGPVEPVLLLGRAAGGRILILRINLRAPVVRLRLASALTLAVAGQPVPIQRIKRMWSTARHGLFAAVAVSVACGSSAADTVIDSGAGGTKHIGGVLVDGDMPALYRLPPVPGETAPVRVARRPDVPESAHTANETRLEIPSFDDAWGDRVAAVAEITPVASEPASMFPYAPNTRELSAQLLPAVQRGYTLAQRGAIAAAETEFIQVLRRIAEAKDIQHGTDQHSRALAAGLRALDEAEDFVPAGIQLEAELDVRIVASSHRTPVLSDQFTRILPHDAVARYHSFAHEQLAAAVAGEQAGSMVLHGLGKVHARIAERDDDLQAARTAMTLYVAALATCPSNHLAANELGVLLCHNGHATEAAAMFQRTIDLTPSATAYHNLAMAQQKLGMYGQAAANERESHRLAAWERASGAVSRRAGVEWVSPAEMSGLVQPAPMMPTVYEPESASHRHGKLVGGTPARSPWQRTIEMAKALPRPGGKSSFSAARTTATRWR